MLPSASKYASVKYLEQFLQTITNDDHLNALKGRNNAR